MNGIACTLLILAACIAWLLATCWPTSAEREELARIDAEREALYARVRTELAAMKNY